MDADIRHGGRDDIERLEPLWRALHAHHATLADMPGVRAVEESWSRRRREYLEWMAAGRATLLLAERGRRLIGYAMVTVGCGPATWALGDRTAEVETLSVLDSERGGGVGRALMAAAEGAARAGGATTVFVAAAHANADAIRFYEAGGFAPFYVLMVKR